MQPPRWVRFGILAVVAAAPLTAIAGGAPADAGLVTRVAGKVSYRTPTRKEPASLTAFMKVRVGDEVQMTDKAELRVVFFASGRAETWRGAAAFKIGERESQLLKGVAPTVENVGTDAVHNLRQVPALLREAGVGRPGASIVRTGGADKPSLSQDDKAELATAKAAYETQRKVATPDDVSPELAYLAVLRDFQQWDDMKAFVTEARKRAPESNELRLIAQWLAKRKPAR